MMPLFGRAAAALHRLREDFEGEPLDIPTKKKKWREEEHDDLTDAEEAELAEDSGEEE